MLHNEILKNFRPGFRSIAKDCDRYSGELVKLFELEEIDARQYLLLSGKGTLWIIDQYIAQGHLDVVEAYVRGFVTSRDFYGPLFEQTQSILTRLLEVSEDDRVFRLYRAAIDHRLRALKDEAATRDQPKTNRQSRTSSAKWVKTVLPVVKKMVTDYEALLVTRAKTDPDLSKYRQTLHTIENP